MRRILLMVVLFALTALSLSAENSAELRKARAQKIVQCLQGKVACTRPTEPGPMGGWILRDNDKSLRYIVYVYKCEKSQNCKPGEVELSFDLTNPQGTISNWVGDVGPKGEVSDSGVPHVGTARYASILRRTDKLLFPRVPSAQAKRTK